MDLEEKLEQEMAMLKKETPEWYVRSWETPSEKILF